MKIKITNKEKVIEGNVFQGVVKPFGTSAHIPFKKEHTGKYADVIIAEDPIYCWIFSDAELKIFLSTAKYVVEKHEGKMKPHYKASIENVKNNKFKLNDIVSLCSLLEDNNKCIAIINKIKKGYSNI